MFGLSAQPTTGTWSIRVGDFIVTSAAGGVAIAHATESSRPVWESAGEGPWLTVGSRDAKIVQRQGTLRVHHKVLVSCQAIGGARLTKVGADGESITLQWSLSGPPPCTEHAVSMMLHPSGERRLEFTFRTDARSFNFVSLGSASPPDEGVYGFGMQSTFLNLKGRMLNLVVQEQGIGRGRQPASEAINVLSPGSAGSPVASNIIAPQYLTSRGHSLFLKNAELATADLTRLSRISLTVQSNAMRGEILAGRNLLEQLELYSEYAGRMRPLPEWFHRGAIVGLQGGTNKVNAVWRELKLRGTPVAAFWLQDWQGQRNSIIGRQLWWNWELDQELYPGWTEMVQALRIEGVRVLGYINPHLVDVTAQGKAHAERNLYREAATAGYLVRTKAGTPYMMRLTAFNSGLVDFSNGAARSWFKDIIKSNLLGVGLSGGMCDFGEGAPTDGVYASGEDGLLYHNVYPEDYERTVREAVSESGFDDDVVFFCRAGFSQSPGQVRLFWQGDQLVTWDKYDGLKSAVQGLIGSGLSGFTLQHSDIGGYTDLAVAGIGLTRQPELLERWEELSAFTAAFRTHEGATPGVNAQFYSNTASLAAFDRNARLFASLFFYRLQLFDEAWQKGRPVVRALFLHYPEDAKSYQVNDEFMLGSEILVAPVLNQQQTRRIVYLPKGKWIHIWSGVAYGSDERGSSITVAAPLGEPPAFYLANSQTGARWRQELLSMGLVAGRE